MKEMSIDDASENLNLDQMLKLLRKDVTRILAQLDQSESLLEVEEVISEEEWLVTPEEHKILDFIRSLALIATELSPELLEETKGNLTEYWKDVVCGNECEDDTRDIVDRKAPIDDVSRV
jgi:hypothetical protein